jgi:cardiolipin synthase
MGARGFGLLLLLCFSSLPDAGAKSIDKLIVSEYAVSDPAFRDVIGNLVGTPLLPGNQVTTLINGVEIFPPQFAAIRSASNTITMENFIFRSGKLSSELVPLLCEKARQGVQVHLIMDSMGVAKLRQLELDALEGAGVHFVKYNRTEWHKLLRINHRDHRKFLMVDGYVGFTGGACLADEWLGNADSKDLWRDTHFEVRGPAVGLMQGVFANNWIQAEHEVLTGPPFFPLLRREGEMWVQCFKSGPEDSAEKARLVYLHSFAAARSHIRIAHSYFVPDRLLVKQLLDARRRGVRIEVITPGIIDANVVRRASRALWGDLLEAGVEFHEYQPSLFHTKVVTVDDCWVLAGTLNLDNRSFRINDENTLHVWDREFCAEQIRQFEIDKAKSKRVTLRDYKARPWYIKLTEHVASWFRALL